MADTTMKYRLMFNGSVILLTHVQYVEAYRTGRECQCGYCFCCAVADHKVGLRNLTPPTPVDSERLKGT